MIGSLAGRLAFKQPPAVIIECHGVGYEVETPMSTFLELPGTGDSVHLYTHLVVREDAHTLYGFATESERSLFRMLLKVSGVGAKMGLAILSAMSVDGFCRCIEYDDAVTLTKIPGVGEKTAKRLIIEMRDRLKRSPVQGTTAKVTVEVGARGEAVDALSALGYKPREIDKLMKHIDVDGKSAEEIIRLALKQAVA